MDNLRSFPPDQRPSALYLIAHQGPLRKPRPVEVQHMRIRRYMNLLREYRQEAHHYQEAYDIFIDFTYTGSPDLPSLLKLGEAIAEHRYRAVFVDLAGTSNFGTPSLRDISQLQIERTLRALPIPIIDVGHDRAGVLQERLSKFYGQHGQDISWQMQEADHDMVCFFPSLSADIANAVLYRDDDQPDVVERRIGRVRSENPYSGGREPWMSDILSTFYGKLLREERQQAEAARRGSGETLYRIQPNGRTLLIEEGLWGDKMRSAESLTAAEARLQEFGFDKKLDGQVVSYERRVGEAVLFADPRTEGKLSIQAYGIDTKRKRKVPVWIPVGSRMTILDSWWKTGAGKRFDQFVLKALPELEGI